MRFGYRRTLLLATAAVAVWSFGYGPLLPWSPLRPGYRVAAGERVRVVYPEGMELPAALQAPDELLEEAERFHRLRANGEIVVFLCPDWPAAYRVLPRLARKGVGAVTLATGTAIYVLPTVAERGLDPVEFVRHELSHAVIHQNQRLLDAVRIVEVQWLAEGIAVWFGRQKAYVSDEEFWRTAPEMDLEAYMDPALRARLGEPFPIRFGYVCWKQFNMYLERRDAAKYWAYLHAAIGAPRRWRELFPAYFDESFTGAVNAFARQVKTEAENRRKSSAQSASEPRTRPSR